jgi:excisionase family DNA binding protein
MTSEADDPIVTLRILTLREVADLLRLTRGTVKLIPPDELPFFRISSRGDRRYYREDVEAFLRSRRQG